MFQKYFLFCLKNIRDMIGRFLKSNISFHWFTLDLECYQVPALVLYSVVYPLVIQLTHISLLKTPDLQLPWQIRLHSLWYSIASDKHKLFACHFSLPHLTHNHTIYTLYMLLYKVVRPKIPKVNLIHHCAAIEINSFDFLLDNIDVLLLCDILVIFFISIQMESVLPFC